MKKIGQSKLSKGVEYLTLLANLSTCIFWLITTVNSSKHLFCLVHACGALMKIECISVCKFSKVNGGKS